MFENDKDNGFFTGNELDLGSAPDDFGGFAPIDSIEADAIFGTATQPQASHNPIEQTNTAQMQQTVPIVNEGQSVKPVSNGNAVNVEETKNDAV